MITQVIVVAGGAPSDWPELANFDREATVWFGVDRGAFYLLEREIVPELAIGDFDSLNSEELARVKAGIPEVITAQPEKDDTDTQLGMMEAISRYPAAEVILIGATGGRLDHFLANLWLPFDPRFRTSISQIQLWDRQNTITYFKPGSYDLTKEADKKYVAFVCLTPITELSLSGVKYPLTSHQVTYPISFSSNEFIGERAQFSFSAGVVAVIQSKD